MSRVLVTGGAGFIGSNLVRFLLDHGDHEVANLDCLTYAGNLANLSDYEGSARLSFHKVDIADPEAVDRVFRDFGPEHVVHLAAESHVDRSVMDATDFIRTNVLGTQVLLDAARRHGVSRFLHVSTDEVYGSLGQSGQFSETSPIQPNSPYSASKAASDFLVRAAHKTHGMDTVITRCSNNYGPYQFPEKLIPLMILNALEDKPLPVYGDGKNVRDWIHVEDHCRALVLVMEQGGAGEVYNLGGYAERANIEVVRRILELTGRDEGLIRFVQDRPGHDRRYAVDGSKVRDALGFRPARDFEEGLAETVEWYRANGDWCES
ncbi:MAG: dTDP-glucose 4,6-dehydratase, partial [Planctomycetota bacterium]